MSSVCLSRWIRVTLATSWTNLAVQSMLKKSRCPARFAMWNEVCSHKPPSQSYLRRSLSSDKASDVTLARGPEYFNLHVAPTGTEETTRSASSHASRSRPDQVCDYFYAGLVPLIVQESIQRASPCPRWRLLTEYRLRSRQMRGCTHRTTESSRRRFNLASHGAVADEVIGVSATARGFGRNV